MERNKKHSQAAEVLAPTTQTSFAEFYTGGGKRGGNSNIDARNLIAEAFINKSHNPTPNPFSQFPQYHPYPDAGYYDQRDCSRSRSRSRRCHHYYSDSSVESLPERSRSRNRRKYKDDRKYSHSPVQNENTSNSIVNID